MYADDATSYHAASTCHKLNLDLSREPYVVYDWIKINKLILNASKTKSIAFGSRHIFVSKPKLDLYISDNKWLNTQDKAKLLGLVLCGHRS